MNNRGKSLSQILAPLQSWDDEPGFSLATITTLLEPGAESSLGFFNSLALDFSLLWNGLTLFKLFAEGLFLMGLVLSVQLALPTQSSPSVGVISKPVSNTSEAIRGDYSRQTLAQDATQGRFGMHDSHIPNRSKSGFPSNPSIMDDSDFTTFHAIASEIGEVHVSISSVNITPGNSATSIPILRSASSVTRASVDDCSGITFGIRSQFSSIPRENGIGGKSLNEFNYSVGYRFNTYHELAIEYGSETFRKFTSKVTTTAVFNSMTGQTSYYHSTTYQPLDGSIGIPGLSYTFRASNLEVLNIEPFISAFGSMTSAGFLWRASGGLAYNPIGNIDVVCSYAWEQLNSGAYSTLERKRSLLVLGIEYRW